jgi:hypothetical protein
VTNTIKTPAWNVWNSRVLKQPSANPAIAGVFGNSLAMREAAVELDLMTEDIMQGMMERTGQPKSVGRS